METVLISFKIQGLSRGVKLKNRTLLYRPVCRFTEKVVYHLRCLHILEEACIRLHPRISKIVERSCPSMKTFQGEKIGAV